MARVKTRLPSAIPNGKANGGAGVDYTCGRSESLSISHLRGGAEFGIMFALPVEGSAVAVVVARKQIAQHLPLACHATTMVRRFSLWVVAMMERTGHAGKTANGCAGALPMVWATVAAGVAAFAFVWNTCGLSAVIQLSIIAVALVLFAAFALTAKGGVK